MDLFLVDPLGQQAGSLQRHQRTDAGVGQVDRSQLPGQHLDQLRIVHFHLENRSSLAGNRPRLQEVSILDRRPHRGVGIGSHRP